MAIAEVFPKSLFGKLPYEKEKSLIASAFKDLVDAMVVLDTPFMKNKVLLLAEFWEKVLSKIVPKERAIQVSLERVKSAKSKLLEVVG